jgi:hypothetical protein
VLGTAERIAHRFYALAAGGVDLISWIACAQADLSVLRGGRLKPGLFHLVSRLRLCGPYEVLVRTGHAGCLYAEPCLVEGDPRLDLADLLGQLAPGAGRRAPGVPGLRRIRYGISA